MGSAFRVRWTSHAMKRMEQRGIQRRQVIHVLEEPAESVETTFGRRASCGKVNEKWLVVVFEGDEELLVISAYRLMTGG
ncbi:MAG: DUF4258 domain-containing protein [Thermoplasmata archaeon]